MNDTITVKILSGGRQAREVNKLGKEPRKSTWMATKFVTTIEWDRWQEVESKLRTFEIVPYAYPLDDEPKTKFELEENSIHQAKVLDNGKILIL
jgi:hypothetical protein